MTRRTLRNTHQTTIRFTEELWIALEHAAERRGVSVAQYIREAARARLGDEAGNPTPLAAEAEMAREHSLQEAESSAALWEQGRLARDRAQMLREEAQQRRRVR
jgi:predicted DNA-binding protein